VRYPTLSEYESVKVVGELPSVGWLRTVKHRGTVDYMFLGAADILKEFSERLQNAVE
jgi:hypothetical protein